MSALVVWISVARRSVSAERNRSPSSTPPPASAAYMRASDRAVKQPLTAGIGLSSTSLDANSRSEPGTMNVSIAGRNHAVRAARTAKRSMRSASPNRTMSSARRSRWSGGAPIDMPSSSSGFTISVSTASCTVIPVTRRITSPTRKPYVIPW